MAAAVSAVLLAAFCAWGQQPAPGPEAALTEALSAACRRDEAKFSGFLTADNAAAYRALPAGQRAEFLKRIVLLEDPGRPLLSAGSTGQTVVRCESPGITTEMRLGPGRLRENLAFIPMQIPIEDRPLRTTTIGLVREGGDWKLISLGLLLLDIPSLAVQWEQSDLEAREKETIAALRTIAEALETYRRSYGKLPETLSTLGPAPPGGISPEAAALLDAELAAGSNTYYTFRYSILATGENVLGADPAKSANFALAATPKLYGKGGKRSFYLDATGALRGADKGGAVATSLDPRIDGR